jgi:hypothetical protein
MCPEGELGDNGARRQVANSHAGKSVRATVETAAVGLEEVWAWLRFLPPFADLAEVIQTPRLEASTSTPQLLINFAPVSHGPWCLQAVIDPQGQSFPSHSVAVRPYSQQHSPWFLWALCNSPVANAFVYTHASSGTADIGTLCQIPVPPATRTQAERIEEAVRVYFRELEVPSSGLLPPQRDANEEAARRRLLQIDAEVLRLYGLAPRLERQLLDLFEGELRPGVPFRFDGYFPRSFGPFIPLHVYLSDEYQRSTAEQLTARHRVIKSPVFLAALREAVEAFEPE